MEQTPKKSRQSIREKMHEIIFEADTFWGKLFDVVLLILILCSILVVMLESVADFAAQYGSLLKTLEWVFTILFTIEYIARVYSVRRPIHYIYSFFGIVDLLAILPTYIGLVMAGGHALTVIRALRLIRVFRIFKLGRYLGEGKILIMALKASRFKITVFLLTVISLSIILGTLMYLIEGSDSGFTSIPRSIYWSIVTLTTVGYGDIAPQTAFGQFIASLIMILGYGIIAVPTGIVSVELANAQHEISTQSCQNCGREGHDHDAEYCKYCGERL
ncbi:ion transporter [Limibacter armeniacum]|uniref:ion transporter n=1 Tax=Limibacter armeniacum TaxID=466084 RepID=UPI002FE658AF